MKPSQLAKLTLALGCFLASTCAASAEHRVKRANLPAAVEAALRRETANAEVRAISRETDERGTYYEAELTVSGRTKDLLIDTQGTVVEVEEQVSLDSLPSNVREAVKLQVRDGEIVGIETLTRGGKLVGYELQIRRGLRKSEIQIGPDGAVLH